MSKSAVADIATYICATYPDKSELSNARLTKLVYLADWASAQISGSQLSDIRWIFNNYGPWVPDVMDRVREDERLEVVAGFNAYGSSKLTVAIRTGVAIDVDSLLSDQTRSIVDSVISDTESMYFAEFIAHVYATIPVVISQRSSVLDLERIARETTSDAFVPMDLKRAGISPTDYANVRDAASRQIARRLLSMPLEALNDVEVDVDLSSIEDFLIDEVVTDAHLEIHRSSVGWSATARSALKLSAEVLRPVNATALGLGLRVIDDNWTPKHVLVGLDAEATCELSVRRSTKQFEVVITSIRLSRSHEASAAF